MNLTKLNIKKLKTLPNYCAQFADKHSTRSIRRMVFDNTLDLSTTVIAGTGQRVGPAITKTLEKFATFVENLSLHLIIPLTWLSIEGSMNIVHIVEEQGLH